MKSVIIDDHVIAFCPFEFEYHHQLINYFNKLSDQSKKRFGPHPFTPDEIKRLFEDTENYHLYIAKDTCDNTIIAYTIVKAGWVKFDAERLKNYGLHEELSDVTLAPSVIDVWQHRGLGKKFLEYIITDLKSNHQFKRIILWGGVQSDNQKAIGLYQKFDFKVLGGFKHNGNNFDMFLEL